MAEDDQVALEPGEYRGFTGYVNYHGTEGMVRNATFTLTGVRPRIIWEGGTWLTGSWDLGVWGAGTWMAGVWKYGWWHSGVWRGGTWLDGTWEGGEWHGGVWKYGLFLTGKWMDGTFENGTFDGTWLGGRRAGGIMHNKVPKSTLTPWNGNEWANRPRPAGPGQTTWRNKP